jgi:3-hydroxybutyryl-CoA dehydrogenase
MGSGIAQTVATSGRMVLLYDNADGAIDRALETIGCSLEKLAAKGGSDPRQTLARITPVADLRVADVFIEAATEDEEMKLAIFRTVDEIYPPEAPLASNTSSIPIGTLAAATRHPDRVIGMHFFNPAPLMVLVEIVRGPLTSDETAAAIVDLTRELGKKPALTSDRPGFVSNRILMPFINEAAYALLDGVADAETIDTIAKLGFNHPIGPLALADVIGLDTCLAIMKVLRTGLGEERFSPCPLLSDLVAEGRLGRKAGAGFFTYS